MHMFLVPIHIAICGISFVTHVTFVSDFTVCPPMNFEMRFFFKSFWSFLTIINDALERPYVWMPTHVVILEI